MRNSGKTDTGPLAVEAAILGLKAAGEAATRERDGIAIELAGALIRALAAERNAAWEALWSIDGFKPSPDVDDPPHTQIAVAAKTIVREALMRLAAPARKDEAGDE